jgi:glycosyltransferase involved in cell wall biosynthesis
MVTPSAAAVQGGERHAVIVSPDPSNAAGGVERMCVLLSGVLEQYGWRVTVVGPGREQTVTLFRLGAGYLEHSHLATRAGRRLAPDLLITNGYLGMGTGRGGVPRVHVYHGTMVSDTRAEGTTLPWRERVRRTIGAGAAEAIAGRGATVVSVSEAAASEVRKFYGVRTDAVIPNGVDITVFSPRPRADARRRFGLLQDERYCLFVGRMQHRKGSDLLLAACSEAGYQLLIAGAGGVDGAHNLGILDPQTLAEAYSACDCVLFPSRYEACSYVVLEALACEAPLLTTRVGWMPTFLRGAPDYDLLCIRPDHDDIVARLRRLGDLDTAELRRSARSWIVEHNSLDSYARHWRELLVKLRT